nr:MULTISPECIES: HAMP domain-containing sensor histidine kinase [Myxococcaceae]
MRQFLGAMLPIALAYFAVYGALALLLHSAALAGGAVAVLPYVVALLLARRAARRGEVRRAALLTGYALLLMVALGAVFLHFLLGALLLIPLAAVAMLLPQLEGRALSRFLVASFLVELWVVLWDGVAPPLLPQPPLWLQRGVLVSAVAASVALTLRLLWVDARRLRQSLSGAEAAVRLRDEFLSVASHELKTPLTPLRMRLHGFGRDLARGAPPERLRTHVEVMERQVRRLGDLVNTLLDVTRLGSGRLELAPEPVELGALVREVALRFELEAEQAGVQLEVAPAAPVVGAWDRLRLEQVLGNLVSNALKYGAGKPVHLSVDAQDGWARVAVQDAGIGIAPEAQARIFGKFERAVSERHYGGLGLGLYVSQQLAQALGGSIGVQSEPGRGARFTVRLPLQG